MLKTRWIRNAAIFGTAVTLSLATYTSVSDNADAASYGQETEMAGLSLSLDKYYLENVAQEEQEAQAADPVATASIEAGAVPATDAAVDAAQNAQTAQTADPAATQAAQAAQTEEQRKEETVAKQFRNLGISTASDYVNIRKKPNTDSKIVGKLYKGSSAEILSEKNGWVKISSGSVTGYIRKDLLAIGADAQKLAGKYGTAYAFLKKGVITLNVRSKKSTTSTIITQIPEDEKYEILGESDNWYKVEIDEGVKGYIAKEFVNTRVRFKKAVSIEEEEAEARRKKAAEEAEQQRLEELARERQSASSSSSSSSSNSSSSSRRSSSSSSSSSSSRRSSSSSSSSSSRRSSSPSVSSSGSGSSIASYATKFVGNPYVWGGSSLTNGADCSGFTMAVYAQFGYSLPHSSGAQAGCGRSVSFSNLQPGDLIFYRNGGSIGHVAMYIGGGRVVHASNKKDGIKISNYRYRTPACARRIIG